MTKDNILRLHKHFSFLADGKFIERDFSVEIPAKRAGEEAGRMSLGKMSPGRRELMISDANRHKKEIEAKFPQLFKGVKDGSS